MAEWNLHFSEPQRESEVAWRYKQNHFKKNPFWSGSTSLFPNQGPGDTYRLTLSLFHQTLLWSSWQSHPYLVAEGSLWQFSLASVIFWESRYSIWYLTFYNWSSSAKVQFFLEVVCCVPNWSVKAEHLSPFCSFWLLGVRVALLVNRSFQASQE